MASEDNFLRLDPYNFDTETEFNEFWFSDLKRGEKSISKKKGLDYGKRSDETGHVSCG